MTDNPIAIRENKTGCLSIIITISSTQQTSVLEIFPRLMDGYQKNYAYDSLGCDTFSDEEDLAVGEADETLSARSGKLEVLAKILPLWHKQGHR